MEFGINEAMQVADAFALDGAIVELIPIKNGNINSTFDVLMASERGVHRYVFQRINTYVFKNPRYIMSNIENVTNHIGKKLAESGGDRSRVMKFYHGADGKNYRIEEGAFWRVADYVANTVTINNTEDTTILSEAGRGFGEFQLMLSDFDASVLYETIPDFHNTPKRIENFLNNVKADPCGRVASVKAEIDAIRRLIPLACKLDNMLDAGLLPLRVTHNDTKINNILFDKDTLKAKTVIDLDTVMPGLVAHDFGDAIRFAANTSCEDEPDTSRTSLDLAKYEAFARGFLSEVKDSLVQDEIDTLALGAFTMTLELVVRFLDDYITGDKYFKLNYPEHNLVRARCQLALALDMEKKLPEMEEIIRRI